MDTAGYIALGHEPVPGPASAGRDVRYEDDFTALQAEIDKMSALAEQEPVNWATVETLAARVLREQSKDLLAAAYLGVALLHGHGAAGLGVGLEIWQGLCDNFWEEAFPALKRQRARINAFFWWQEKTTDWLRRYNGDPLDAEAQAAVLKAAQTLDRTLAERMPDMPPWADTINLIKGLPVKAASATGVAAVLGGAMNLLKKAVSSDAAPSAPVATEQAPSAASAGPAVPEDAAGARKMLAQAATVCAGFMLEHAPDDPLGWQAGRLAAWACLERLPPSEGGSTLLEAPEPAVRAGIEQLLGNRDYLEAAKAADAQKNVYFFWLDPHRLACEALEKLNYTLAAAAVRQETKLFTLRFAGVERLRFSDGTPFADAATLAWLEEAGAGGGSAVEASPPLFEEAEKLAAQGETTKALALLAEEGLSARAGFRRLLALAAQVRLLARAGHAAIAAPLADAILAEIQTHNLETWDPPLAVQALVAAREAYAGLGEEGGKHARAVTARLMRLDPTALPEL